MGGISQGDVRTGQPSCSPDDHLSGSSRAYENTPLYARGRQDTIAAAAALDDHITTEWAGHGRSDGCTAPDENAVPDGHGPAGPFTSGRADECWVPGFMSFVLVYVAYFAVGLWAWERQPGLSSLDWYASVVWTLPVLTSAIGLVGGLRTARRMHRQSRPPPHPVVQDMLVVVVPTIGRRDTYPALERVVRSFCRELPRLFLHLRIDVVIEEACQARDEIMGLASPSVRVITIPGDYQTPNGTRFKARANHYAHTLRLAEGEARDDVWVLHMDDDTGVGPDTAQELAHFISSQRSAGQDALDLAQGVLCFPREYAGNRLTWLADAVRPGCDIGLFAATTGCGSPYAGLHGELLLVRASVEAAIGWDFGPRAIVEDAQFALWFCDRYPGRSGWIPGRSYGASPATVGDFIRQRGRWVSGLLELAMEPKIPLRRRLLLMHNVVVWVCAAMAHPAVVLLAGTVLGDVQATPASAALVPLWALNIAFCAWLYWEGLKLNTRSSAQPRSLWWERLCLVALSPLFSIWEIAGLSLGLVRFLKRGKPGFTVIRKPV
jgi:egghead protein (zeste-white 4 protein)